MMVEMNDGNIQGEPGARRERTLSTKPIPGGQRDGREQTWLGEVGDSIRGTPWKEGW